LAEWREVDGDYHCEATDGKELIASLPPSALKQPFNAEGAEIRREPQGRALSEVMVTTYGFNFKLTV
jgi:hypothetical protein